MRRLSGTLALAVLAMTFCDPAGAARTGSWQAGIISHASGSIDRANAEWARAIVAGDADTLAKPYAEDAIFIGPGGLSVRGRTAIRAMYERRQPDVKVVRAWVVSDGRGAGDPAHVYEWGHAWMLKKSGKRIERSGGRYLTVWQLEGGRWLIAENIAF